jgi:hypothetical protein
MSKSLIPSPNVRTVIPEAIRIAEVRLPDPKKTTLQQQTIEIIDSEEESLEAVRQRKIQFHREQLELEREGLGLGQEKGDITAEEEAVFEGLC